MFVTKNTPLSSSNSNINKISKKIGKEKNEIIEDKAKENEDTVSDIYKSEEIRQCIDPSEYTSIRKNKRLVDDTDEVTKSCLDLAIDG